MNSPQNTPKTQRDRLGRRLATLAGLLALLAGRGLAVDPLPPAIEKASLPTIEAYLEQAGQESEQLRRQYAQQRYEERRRYRQEVAMAMRQAVEEREQLLAEAPTASPAASSSAVAPARAPLASRLFPCALAGLAAVLVYHFRERLFRRFYA